MVNSIANAQRSQHPVNIDLLSYRVISTSDVTNLIPANDKYSYMDTSLPWLLSTIKYIFTDTQDIYWHCLTDGDDVYITLPLINEDKIWFRQLSSLVCFYSNSIRPYYFCEESHQALFSRLIEVILEQTRCHQIRIGPVDECGDLVKVINSTLPFKTKYASEKNWYNTCVSNYQEFYESLPSKLRNTVQRRQKKLTKLHSWSIEYVSDMNSFKKLFEAYRTIYKSSWKQPEYSYDFIQNVCMSALDRNQLRMAVLFVDGCAAASQIWFFADGKASIFKLAYDEQYKSLSVGSILTADMFKSLIENDGPIEVEYGVGDETYKSDWMEKSRQRITLDIYNATTVRGKLLYIFKRIKQNFSRNM